MFVPTACLLMVYNHIDIPFHPFVHRSTGCVRLGGLLGHGSSVGSVEVLRVGSLAVLLRY